MTEVGYYQSRILAHNLWGLTWRRWGISMIGFVLGMMIGMNCRSGESTIQPGEIARLGDEVITLEEMRMAYELDPSFPSIRKGKDGLRDYLEEMLDKRLAYQQAQSEQLFNESSFNRYLESQIRRSVVKDYYQCHVAQRIVIHDDELRRAFRLSRIRFRLKSLGIKDVSTSKMNGVSPTVSMRIEDLDLQAADTSSQVYDLNGWELEDFQAGSDGVFSLKPGQLIGPFKTEDGYRYLQLLDRKDTMMVTESDYQMRKKGLERRLRHRKERIKADSFLTARLNPMNIRVKRKAMELVYHGMMGEHRDGVVAGWLGNAGSGLTDEGISRLRAGLKSALTMPLITSQEMNWSIDSFLLYLDKLPQEQRPRIESITRFTNDLGGLIRDEIIDRLARRESNRWRSVADSVIEPIKMQWAYQFYRSQAYRNFVIPIEIDTYYQTRHHMDSLKGKVPPSILPGMNHPDIYRWYYSGKKLHQELIGGGNQPDIRYQESLLEAESARIDWGHPVRIVMTQR